MRSPRTRSDAPPLAAGLFVGLVLGAGIGFLLGRDATAPRFLPPVRDAVVRPTVGAILGRGPHEGYVVVLDPAHYRLEVVHNEHWGIVGAFLYDAQMEPVEVDAPPVLNLMFDEASVGLVGGQENWDGEEDGGWHWEHDALLGVPEPGRFRLLVGGRTYLPFFAHVHLDDGQGHGQGHAHEVE